MCPRRPYPQNTSGSNSVRCRKHLKPLFSFHVRGTWGGGVFVVLFDETPPFYFHVRIPCPVAQVSQPDATRISFFIPEGCLIIAQRFNVGCRAQSCFSPEGTAEIARIPSAVPSGLRPLPALVPTLKRWAIVACPSGTEASRTFRLCLRAINPSGVGFPNPLCRRLPVGRPSSSHQPAL